MLDRVDLNLEPNEASDLCQVHEPGLLDAHGWDVALLTVLDEAAVEDAVVMLGHDAGAGPIQGWSTFRLRFDAGEDAGRSDDAEVVSVRQDGRVYVLGSHYGAKTGPLQPDRQRIARFDHGKLGANGSRRQCAHSASPAQGWLGRRHPRARLRRPPQRRGRGRRHRRPPPVRRRRGVPGADALPGRRVGLVLARPGPVSRDRARRRDGRSGPPSG